MQSNEVAALAAIDVRKVFEQGQVRTEVLKGIDVEFARGDFAAIVGPSGSGKSTLLYVLGALDQPTSGDVVIAGQSIAAMEPGALARLRNERLGFIFQFHFLLPEFTALENVMLPQMIHGGAPRASAEAWARELLSRVGLSQKAASRPGRLSGGEQQRVAIARALANHPEIVLCDEPTGNLDTANSRQVFDLLRELNQERQQTIIVVTHDPEFAGRMDRIVRLVDGRVESDVRTG